MNRVLSTHVCVNHRLTIAWLNQALQAGIPAVEIFCARQHLDYRNRSQIAELGHWFRDAELKLHSIHSPMYTDEIWGRSGPHALITITEPLKSKRIAMVDEIKRALDIAELIPFRYMVQHLGVGEEEFDERKIDAAFSALEEHPAREYSEPAFHRRTSHVFHQDDAPRPEFRIRRRSRQHRRRSRAGIRDHEGAHPLDPCTRQ
jgi:hypothetical protein